MLQKRRNFRKNLSSKGLIFLAGKEHHITLRNLSITGVMAELVESDAIRDIEGVFDAIKTSTVVDIYLKELNLAGEVDVVRADLDEGRILLALEFKNISYNVNDLEFKRKSYRKNMSIPGYIVCNKEIYKFYTHNVSVDGLMIKMPETVLVEQGTVTDFEFQNLELKGEVKIVWIDYDDTDGSTMMGLQYQSMIKKTFKGVPSFSFESST